MGYAWFCPRCGEIWAHMHLPGRKYMVWSRPCDRHKSVREPAGSLWLSWDYEYLKALPEPVLRREVELHFKHYEDKYGREQAYQPTNTSGE
jgi:hypothetical protein